MRNIIELRFTFDYDFIEFCNFFIRSFAIADIAGQRNALGASVESCHHAEQINPPTAFQSYCFESANAWPQGLREALATLVRGILGSRTVKLSFR